MLHQYNIALASIRQQHHNEPYSQQQEYMRHVIKLSKVKGVNMNMNQVTIPVKSMNNATRFYRKIGFLQIVDTPHYARFECAGNQASFSISLNQEEYRNGAAIYFEHQDLDVLVAKLIKKGIEFIELPKEKSYLWREATLADPSSNIIKLYWAGENRLNPPWRVEITD